MNSDCPDTDVCKCGCHDPKQKMIHVMECCNVCPHCSKNIVIRAYTAHVARCKCDIKVDEPPSRKPQLGPSPTEGDETFRKLCDGARRSYGYGGGYAGGEAGEAD